MTLALLCVRWSGLTGAPSSVLHRSVAQRGVTIPGRLVAVTVGKRRRLAYEGREQRERSTAGKELRTLSHARENPTADRNHRGVARGVAFGFAARFTTPGRLTATWIE